MYIGLLHTESGDRYLIGPWTDKPTKQAAMDLFGEDHPEEADYCEELGTTIWLFKLPDTPKTKFLDGF